MGSVSFAARGSEKHSNTTKRAVQVWKARPPVSVYFGDFEGSAGAHFNVVKNYICQSQFDARHYAGS